MAINGVPTQQGQIVGSGVNSRTVGSGQGWSAPDSGDIILLCASFRHRTSAGIGTITWPSGFTAVHSFTTEQASDSPGPGFATQAKISDGTESSLTVSLSSTPSNFNLWAMAFDPTDLDTTIANFQTSINSTNWETDQTSVTCGPITNTAADALCIAYHVNETASTTWGGSTNFDNGFTDRVDPTPTNGSSSSATKVVSTSASQSCDATPTSGTGTELLGMMIIINSLPVVYEALEANRKRRRDPRIKM